MPDITMCSGNDCKFKSNCYRYTAEASIRQSYFTESPIESDKCDYYLEVESDYDKARR